MGNIPSLLPLPPEDAMNIHVVPPPQLPPEYIIPNEPIIQAVNMGFNSFCYNDALRDAIQEYIGMVHLLQIESCCLLNLYILYLFQNNPNGHFVPPIHRKAGGIMRQFYSGIIKIPCSNSPLTHNTVSNPQLEEFIANQYLPLPHPPEMPYINMSNLSHTVDALTKEHVTVYMNHVTINPPPQRKSSNISN